jgi:hypothetical protein
MGTGPAETILPHPCHLNGLTMSSFPMLRKQILARTGSGPLWSPRILHCSSPNLKLSISGAVRCSTEWGVIVHDTTSRMRPSPPSSRDGDTVEVGVFRRFVAQMSGTASRITFERLSEVRNARPNLRQMIDPHPHRRRLAWTPGSREHNAAMGFSVPSRVASPGEPFLWDSVFKELEPCPMS